MLKCKLMNTFDMKKIILLLISVISFALADISMPRYDEGVHQGLPGWVVLRTDFSKRLFVNNVSFGDADYKVISLDSYHAITYMGKIYNALTVFSDGRIMFGDATEGLNVSLEPHVRPLNVSSRIAYSFSWQSLSEEIDQHYDYYTVVQFDGFSVEGIVYNLQIILYTDGEIQTQLWQKDAENTSVLSKAWMEPRLFNGNNYEQYNCNTDDKTATVANAMAAFVDCHNVAEMAIYDERGLRPGWIGKALKSSYTTYGFSLEESAGVGNGIYVNMGTDYDAGGLLAYDFSREHPVVGSIKEAVFELASPVTEHDYTRYWYFTEDYADVQNTYNAHYPWFIDSLSKKEMHMNVLSFAQSLENMTFKDQKNPWSAEDAYTDRVQLIPAPAFKFQLPNFHTVQDANVSLIFKSIRYKLNQLPSYQFLPPKPYGLNVQVAGNGRAIAKVPANGFNPYRIFKGKTAEISIEAKPGSEIKNVKINGIVVYNAEAGGFFIGKMYPLGIISKVLNVGLTQDNPGLMHFYVSNMVDNITLEITFDECSGRTLDYAIPQTVKTKNFLDPQSASDVRSLTTVEFKNSFGGSAQKQDSLDTDKYVVSTEYTDAFGNKKYVPLNFVRDTAGFGYLDKACYDCIIKSNAYYNGSDSLDRLDGMQNAYTETKSSYEQGNGSLGYTAGVAGKSLDYVKDQPESWAIPVWDSTAFIQPKYLNDEDIFKLYAQNISNPGPYTLTVSRDIERRYTQTMTNELGQQVASWYYDGSNAFIVGYEYDAYGKLVKSYTRSISYATNSTEPERFVAENIYDEQGRVVKTISSDRGFVETKYDKYGRVRFVRNKNDSINGDGFYSANVYDNQGRIIKIGSVRNGSGFNNPDGNLDEQHFYPRTSIIFGKPSLNSILQSNISTDSRLIGDILGQMSGVYDSDVGAKFAYDYEGNAVSVKMGSYDRLGRKNRQWIIYSLSGIPAVQLRYSFNVAGELENTYFDEWDGNSWVNKNVRKHSYDNQGRIDTTWENGALLATYNYSDLGKLSSSNYYDNGNLVYTKKNVFDIYGRAIRIAYEKNNTELYSEDLEYPSATVGRVNKINHKWKNVLNEGSLTKSNSYTYNYSGQLTNVGGSINANYSYDTFGRIVTKVEGNDHIEFGYHDFNKYRPTGFSVNGSSQSASSLVYEYDSVGNVWFDRLSLTAFKLNSLALPEKMYKFKRMPTNLTLQDVQNDNFKEDTLDAVISIAYDEVGNRIWYSVRGTGFVGYTEAVIPGVGTYRRSGNGAYALTHMELIDGGYRAGGTSGSNAAYYPVKDAQGSVRGYSTAADGMVSYYDYYPYGAVASSSIYGTDDKKLWQSKDYDEEIGKFYFGARYYDPFLGLWMSPDPAEQFANPYTYGGDPVNYVDPDGRFLLSLVFSIAGEIYSNGWSGKWDWGRIANSTWNGMLIDALGGPFSAGAVFTTFSYVNRAIFSDASIGDLAGDFFGGGFLADYIGHSLGALNVRFGGTIDWRKDGQWLEGNMVYSEGTMPIFKSIRGGDDFAFSHFGHAVFASNRNKRGLIAHEFRHIAQMEKRGWRWGYYYSYLSNGPMSPGDSYEDRLDYYDNPYEIDAYYTEYLYDNGYVDIMGRKKGQWDHSSLPDGDESFRNWYLKRNGYIYDVGDGWTWDHSNLGEHGPEF